MLVVFLTMHWHILSDVYKRIYAVPFAIIPKMEASLDHMLHICALTDRWSYRIEAQNILLLHINNIFLEGLRNRKRLQDLAINPPNPFTDTVGKSTNKKGHISLHNNKSASVIRALTTKKCLRPLAVVRIRVFQERFATDIKNKRGSFEVCSFLISSRGESDIRAGVSGLLHKNTQYKRGSENTGFFNGGTLNWEVFLLHFKTHIHVLYLSRSNLNVKSRHLFYIRKLCIHTSYNI